MSQPRFFCALPLADGVAIDLPDSVARHAAQVLRLSTGAEIVLFNGEGGEYPARLEVESKTKARALLGARQDIERESPRAITLAQAMQAADKMDFTLQKAVELGVTAFQPLASRRSVTRLAGERLQKRENHWRAVAIAACEQCGRNRLPKLLPYIDVEHWALAGGVLADGNVLAGSLKLMLAPNGEIPLSALANRMMRDEKTIAAQQDRRDIAACQDPKNIAVCQDIVLLVGAEGGLDAGEMAAARRAGFISVRLGPRILRTETAGVAALAVIQSLWGDF
jgi:16S rRNA (uracil1498-N3)-methyltransferase